MTGRLRAGFARRNSRNPARISWCGKQVGYFDSLNNCYARIGADSFPNHALDQQATRTQHHVVRAPAGRPTIGLQSGKVYSGIEVERAALAQSVVPSGEQGLQLAPPPIEHRVRMAALGDTFAMGRVPGQRITLEQRHTLEVLGQHVCRAHPSNTAANHDGMLCSQSTNTPYLDWTSVGTAASVSAFRSVAFISGMFRSG